MMLRYKVRYLLRQIDFFCQLNPIRDMAGDNAGTLRRTHVIVRVLALLIFDKVLRSRDLADVMIESPNAGQKRIGSNCAAGVLSKLSYCMRMLVRPGSAQRQLA